VESPNPVLLFDGVCNLCNSFVRFVLRFETTSEIFFSPLQSQYGLELQKKMHLNPEQMDSLVFVKDDLVYIKSNAVLQILKYLRGPIRILSVLSVLPEWLRDKIYDRVAKSRYSLFGQREACMVPTKEQAARFL